MLNRGMSEEAAPKPAGKPGVKSVQSWCIFPFHPQRARTKVSLPPGQENLLCWMGLLRKGMERVEVSFQRGIRLAPGRQDAGEPSAPAPSTQAGSFLQRFMWWPVCCSRDACIVLRSKLPREETPGIYDYLSALSLRRLSGEDNEHSDKRLRLRRHMKQVS